LSLVDQSQRNSALNSALLYGNIFAGGSSPTERL
jgi:hypothetical protein